MAEANYKCSNVRWTPSMQPALCRGGGGLHVKRLAIVRPVPLADLFPLRCYCQRHQPQTNGDGGQWQWQAADSRDSVWTARTKQCRSTALVAQRTQQCRSTAMVAQRTTKGESRIAQCKATAEEPPLVALLGAFTLALASPAPLFPPSALLCPSQRKKWSLGTNLRPSLCATARLRS